MKKNLLPKISRIVSEIFNGFLTMILAPTLAFVISDVNIIYKLLFPLLYLIVTIAPFIILRKMGKISDYEFTKREERPLYFTITTIGYLILFLLTLLLKDTMLIPVTLNIFVATCVLTIVTLYWKMSGHMTYSTVLFFTLMYLFPYATLLPLIFLFTPLIAASRVILKKHTIMQTIVGTLVSATISILILWVL
ncbi:phosphatase PAP2 family protein [Patescibacteria group bacterium]|nr:phosphatase PAP2 family protein [Patescibacteria group bacterium]